MLINRVTLLGHKDHGKSTLIGTMLMVTGAASEQRINEAKKTSKELGRRFEPGYILDSFEEERKGEMTIDTTRAQVMYKDTAFEFIDVPGHEELIKNMISGASYASFALLVVSAKPDEGIKDQTKRHLFIAKMLGIRRIVVAVNKMDTINYDEKRYTRIKDELLKFLEKIGFKRNNIKFVPISAYNSENLISRPKAIKWYEGKPLLETMAEVANHEQNKPKFLRLIVQGDLESASGNLITGKVLAGTIKVNQDICIAPSNEHYEVVKIFVKGRSKKSASAGENIAMKLDKELKGIRGSVVFDEKDALRGTKKLDSTIFLTRDLKKNAKIRFNGNDYNATISVRHSINTITGDEPDSKETEPLGAAHVDILLDQAIPAEPFEKTPELGRFVIYTNNEFSGIGIVN